MFLCHLIGAPVMITWQRVTKPLFNVCAWPGTQNGCFVSSQVLHQGVNHIFEDFLKYNFGYFCFFPNSQKGKFCISNVMFLCLDVKGHLSLLSVSENIFTCQIFHVRENPDCGLKSFSCHVSN